MINGAKSSRCRAPFTSAKHLLLPGTARPNSHASVDWIWTERRERKEFTFEGIPKILVAMLKPKAPKMDTTIAPGQLLLYPRYSA
eukprot:985320-Rhodomonas_salina.1